jgi:hypothetical protein
MRIRLKRDHSHNGNLKRPGTVIDLHPASARQLIKLGVAQEILPPSAGNQRKK